MNDRTAALPTPSPGTDARAQATPARGDALSNTLQRLHLLRFPLVISVLFFHSVNPVQVVPGADASWPPFEPWAALVHGFLAHGLGGIRMPAFFAISGFLFFASHIGTREWLTRKLGSRVRGVLVPLLAWNALLLPVLLALQAWPPSNAYFSGLGTWSRPVADYGPWQVLDALLGLSGYPIVYPLWFLRDLFLMCLIAPLYLLLSRPAQAVVVGGLGLLWFSGAWPFQVPTIEALFFFSAGALAALWRLDPAPLDRHAWTVFALLVGLVTAHLVLPAQWMAPAPALLHLTQLAALAALLVLTRFIERLPALAQALRYLAAPSFFIFVAHEPLLTAVRRLLHGVWPPHSSDAVLALYFAGVGVTALLLIAVFHAARQWAPRTLAFLTGGRSRATHRAGAANA